MIGPLLKGLADEVTKPIATAFVVGGGGASGVRALRALRADRLVLAEADPDLADALRRQVSARRGEEVVALAMTDCQERTVPLRILSNRRYSSTRAPLNLRRAFPNIHDVRTIRVPAEPIAESIAKLGLDAKADNLLVLDVPGEASALLECLPDADLQAFAWVLVRCSDVPLYDSEAVAGEILARMERAGFDLARESAEAIFPERALLLARNPARIEAFRLGEQLERAGSINSTLASQLQARQEDLARTRNDLVEQQALVGELKGRLEREAASREQVVGRLAQLASDQQAGVRALRAQLDEAARRRERDAEQAERLASGHATAFDALRERLDEVLAQGSRHAQQVGEATSGLLRAGQFGERMGDLLAALQEQKEILSLLPQLVRAIEAQEAPESAEEAKEGLARLAKGLARKIDASMANAAKQVEAFVGVHRYLDSGKLPSLSTEAHAWPISPDFANYLLELIETNNYDAVVEFGSGYSTLLIAQAVSMRAKTRRRKRPVELVAFEHLETYLAKTRAQLEQAGVAGMVDLVHAPLEPYEGPNGVTYPYYSCLDRIGALAETHDVPRTKVLVVVDGPPGKTAQHARYPAVPVVLSRFSKCRVDFLVDDYARPDEKEVVEMWGEELSRTGRSFRLGVRRLEKEACLLIVGAGKPRTDEAGNAPPLPAE